MFFQYSDSFILPRYPPYLTTKSYRKKSIQSQQQRLKQKIWCLLWDKKIKFWNRPPLARSLRLLVGVLEKPSASLGVWHLFLNYPLWHNFYLDISFKSVSLRVHWWWMMTLIKAVQTSLYIQILKGRGEGLKLVRTSLFLQEEGRD